MSFARTRLRPRRDRTDFLVRVTSRSGDGFFHYGVFADRGSADYFAEHECPGLATEVVELITIERVHVS